MTSEDTESSTAGSTGNPIIDAMTSRLRSSSLSIPQQALVQAALKGPEALEAQLLGEILDDKQVMESSTEVARNVFLRSLTIAGFRGIGPPAKLEVEPGPGLTLIVGRNGSGKSSFADGLEMLLTGETWRWLEKSKVWTSGWRNLHEPTGAEIRAEFIAEGAPSPLAAGIRWDDDAGLGDGNRFSQPRGRPRQPFFQLGWSEYVDITRPFLSYSELGGLLDVGPTKLYDSLSKILGLERLVNATESLRQHRLNRGKAYKALKASLTKEILPRLSASDDDRARQCEIALRHRQPKLDIARRLVETSSAIGTQGELERLRQLASMEIPQSERVDNITEELGIRRRQLVAHVSTDAGHASQVADLLSAALKHFEEHGDGDCPVCGSTRAMNPAWAASATNQLARLETEANDYREAEAAVKETVRAIRNLPPVIAVDISELSQLLTLTDTSEIHDALNRWNAALAEADDADITAALAAAVGPAAQAARTVQSAARAELDRREDAWRPVAAEVRRWIGDAELVLNQYGAIPEIEGAEKWLRKATQEVRASRFHPIAQQSQRIWAKLNLQSNVHVSDVVLTGNATMRRVDIQVDVDGVEGVALGVMSQGELHSLVLSLFLPRACMDESPFRFVVIDDPVQAMDPVRVDGLAAVLGQISEDRQVIVFTHDDRLPEAIRRLQIPARIVEVLRRPGSVVELRKSLDPIQQALSDARAIARSSGVPDAVRGRVTAGFCRSAIEAACVESIRGRWLSDGRTHADVEGAIADATRLTHYLSLCLFDDINRGGEVLPTINQRWGHAAGDAFQTCNRGIHEGYTGDLRAFSNDCGSLAERLRRL